MDIVRGLSDFGGSELFCGLFASDLNNFCCMLRMLVAMIDVHVQRRTRVQHALAIVLHNRRMMTSLNFETHRFDRNLPGLNSLNACVRAASVMGAERVCLSRAKNICSGVCMS
jgi:hypothetical protein